MGSRWFKVSQRWAIAFLAGLLLVQLLGVAVWWLSWPQLNPTMLSFVVPLDEAAVWQPLIADFEAQNPDIRLELVEGTYNTDQVKAIYTADLSSGNPQHDLVYTDRSGTVTKFPRHDKCRGSGHGA